MRELVRVWIMFARVAMTIGGADCSSLSDESECQENNCAWDAEVFTCGDVEEDCTMTSVCESCDMSGPEKKLGTGFTLQQCKDRCLERNDCHGMDFGKNGQAGECYINIDESTQGGTHHASFDGWIKQCKAPVVAFEGVLDGKDGASPGLYRFQAVVPDDLDGNYNEVMIKACAAVDMKPLCDDPAYCKHDMMSVCIGQTHHIAHKPQRDVDAHFPGGWDELKVKFPKVFCTYAAQKGGAKTLCTSGAGHSWQAKSNQAIMCAAEPEYIPDAPFTGELSGENGANAGNYTFQRVRAQVDVTSAGTYDEVMISECAKVGMKPLCDNPTYCKSDTKSVYIGQSHNIAHKPHRNINSYFPTGWDTLKHKFPDTFCTYTANSGGAAKSLCTTGAGHSWQSVTGNPEIMCAVAPPFIQDPPFEGELGAKNFAPAGVYKFQRVRTNETSGDFDDIMVAECAKVGMKPLCDQATYCQHDINAVYIGQTQSISHNSYRNIASYYPSGWDELKLKFPTRLCTYKAHHGSSARSLCSTGGASSWQAVGVGYQDILCALAPEYTQDEPFEGELETMNGANAGLYQFRRVRTHEISGSYDDIMLTECGKVGMKPLCDSPTYCKNDPKSVYLGQTNHIAHTPHRNVNSYFPDGWDELKAKFPTTFCTYTAHHGGAAKSLCTTGAGHSWQSVVGNPQILCAKAPAYRMDPPFQGELGSKSGSNAGLYKFQRVRTNQTSGNYDDIMIKECEKFGMKPLCDSPTYCKNDPNSVYLGQTYHIAHNLPHQRLLFFDWLGRTQREIPRSFLHVHRKKWGCVEKFVHHRGLA
jgi:hypothetical protein